MRQGSLGRALRDALNCNCKVAKSRMRTAAADPQQPKGRVDKSSTRLREDGHDVQGKHDRAVCEQRPSARSHHSIRPRDGHRIDHKLYDQPGILRRERT